MCEHCEPVDLTVTCKKCLAVGEIGKPCPQCGADL